MAKDERMVLEGIASDMGAVAPGNMEDEELIVFITQEEETR